MESELQLQFATEDISILAKENGFNESCLGFYMLSHTSDKYIFSLFCEDLYYSSTKFAKNSDLDVNPTGRLKKCFTAPLWQQIIDWFRTKYKILLDIHIIVLDDLQNWDFHYQSLKDYLELNEDETEYDGSDIENPGFTSYELAREAGIKEVFKAIKQNKL